MVLKVTSMTKGIVETRHSSPWLNHCVQDGSTETFRWQKDLAVLQIYIPESVMVVLKFHPLLGCNQNSTVNLFYSMFLHNVLHRTLNYANMLRIAMTSEICMEVIQNTFVRILWRLPHSSCLLVVVLSRHILNSTQGDLAEWVYFTSFHSLIWSLVHSKRLSNKQIKASALHEN